MPTDYTGLPKVLKALNDADFSKLAVKRKKNQLIFLEGEKEDIIDRFNDWCEDYVDPGRNDFETLTMELSGGTKSKEPIVFSFSFTVSNLDRLAQMSGFGQPKVSDNLMIEYGKLISEVAILRSQEVIYKDKISSLEKEVEDLETELDEQEEKGGGYDEAINGFLKDQINGFRLANKQPAAMAGVDTSINAAVEGLQKLDPDFKTHINKLFFLASNDMETYKMATDFLNSSVLTEDKE